MAQVGELSVGDEVICPESLIRPAYKAVVARVSDKVFKKSDTIEYCYISVREPDTQNRGAVWPSNRLSKV